MARRCARSFEIGDIEWTRNADEVERAARDIVSILKGHPLQRVDAADALVAGRGHKEKLSQLSEPISYKEIGSLLDTPLAYFDGQIGGTQ